MKRELSPRAKYIHANYKLERVRSPIDRRVEAWRAVQLYQGRVVFETFGQDRAQVIAEFRRQCSHFNHQDEADAFAEIFR